MAEARTEALSECIFTEMVGGMSLPAVYLGHRLALYMKFLDNDSYPLRQPLMINQITDLLGIVFGSV